MQSQTPHSSTQQFNATPRFNFSSTPRQSQNPLAPTPSAARFSTPGPKPFKPEDDIQQSSDSLPDHVHDSIEADELDVDTEYGSGFDDGDFVLGEPGPKRRRVTSPMISEGDGEPDLLADEEEHVNAQVEEGNFSSSLPILSSPPAPRRPTSSTHSKFLLSTPLPQSTPQLAQTPSTAFLKPPRFRPPDPSEIAENASDPLPDQFSPHRKGHKYIPGGLAAEVRDWLVNIESTIPAQKNREDQWLVKVVVDEVSGGGRAGMSLVSGRQVQEDENGELDMVDDRETIRVILAGEGQGVGVQKGAKVEVGRTVGIKGPVWEIFLDGHNWGVGVDWKVLL